MKTESTVKPTEKFIFDDIRNNKYDVYFNDLDSIEEETRQRENEEEKYTIYKYNMYKVTVWKRNNLQTDIEQNYETWLNFARQQEYDELAKQIREKRDKLLADTDKEMVLDRLHLEMPEEITISNIVQALKDFFTSLKNIKNSEIAKYRQALRDIPQQEGFPYNVVFPEKPVERNED